MFNGDITAWDVSSAKNMSAMFDGNITAWDASSAKI